MRRELRSQTDYILGIDCRLFRNVTVQDPYHNSYHYLVLGCLRGAPLREHTEYLGRSKRPPLQTTTTPAREDGIFAALRRAIPKPKAREAWKNVWILESTWRIINERFSALRDPARDQALIWRLGIAINASLREERRRRTEEAGEGVNWLLGTDPHLHREAWHRMKG